LLRRELIKSFKCFTQWRLLMTLSLTISVLRKVETSLLSILLSLFHKKLLLECNNVSSVSSVARLMLKLINKPWMIKLLCNKRQTKVVIIQLLHLSLMSLSKVLTLLVQRKNAVWLQTTSPNLLLLRSLLYLPSICKRRCTFTTKSRRFYLSLRSITLSRPKISMSMVDFVKRSHSVKYLQSQQHKVSLTRNSSQQNASLIVVSRFLLKLLVSTWMHLLLRMCASKVNIRWFLAPSKRSKPLVSLSTKLTAWLPQSSTITWSDPYRSCQVKSSLDTLDPVPLMRSLWPSRMRTRLLTVLPSNLRLIHAL